MKTALTLFAVFLLFSSCHQKEDLEEVKKKFGAFQDKSIILKEVDYTKTPIYKNIQHHPENYKYLEEVSISSMAYQSDGLFITGFVVQPKQEGNYPVIIFNRGGNRDLGRLLVATAVNVMAPLAAHGYVVVASNYRGTSSSEGNDEFGGDDLHDILNLIESIGEIKSADASRIGLLGISRGGMMNYLCLRNNQHSAIKTAVTIGGITDLNTTIKYHPEIGDVAKELIPDYDASTLPIEKRSAVYWCDDLPTDCPLLILHSEIDQHVNYSQIPPFTDSLSKYGVPFELHSYPDASHGLGEYKEEVHQLILNWFDAQLK